MNSAPADVRPSAQTLFPAEKIPYLIVTPQYTGMSAGVRVLHALCHTLNMLGERAYITTFPQLVIDTHQGAYTCPDLCTPLMTPEILAYFESQGRSPIVVYREAERNNPLNATHVARYVLNYPGLLGGDKTYADHEMVFAYSNRLADAMGLSRERVLFMPVSDPNIFYPPPEGTVRSGSCFYASKYRDFHKGKLFPATKNSVEITRYQPDSLTKTQIADLFRRSEVFYAYEDTALAIEAALCGCPTVFLPNDYFKSSLGMEEIGPDGFSWGDAPQDVARAKATVGNFQAHYQELIDQYWAQLKKFVAFTQAEAAASTRPGNQLTLPSMKRFHTMLYVLDYYQQYGFRRTAFKAALFMRKFGFVRVIRHALRNAVSR